MGLFHSAPKALYIPNCQPSCILAPMSKYHSPLEFLAFFAFIMHNTRYERNFDFKVVFSYQPLCRESVLVRGTVVQS